MACPHTFSLDTSHAGSLDSWSLSPSTRNHQFQFGSCSHVFSLLAYTWDEVSRAFTSLILFPPPCAFILLTRVLPLQGMCGHLRKWLCTSRRAEWCSFRKDLGDRNLCVCAWYFRHHRGHYHVYKCTLRLVRQPRATHVWAWWDCSMWPLKLPPLRPSAGDARNFLSYFPIFPRHAVI